MRFAQYSLNVKVQGRTFSESVESHAALEEIAKRYQAAFVGNPALEFAADKPFANCVSAHLERPNTGHVFHKDWLRIDVLAACRHPASDKRVVLFTFLKIDGPGGETPFFQQEMETFFRNFRFEALQ